ncbi:MAG: hypothetical protein OER86_10310 [Phycisphaerae bacterium]|nr:hypothetical protein [Phycisphaerae bacterium]
MQANLPDAEVHHERTGFDKFGVDTPDLSHFTLFNSQGNVPKVREFWTQKLQRIASGPRRVYAEISHLLMKAGLVENIDLLGSSVEIHFIVLRRDYGELLWSFKRRFDFVNTSNMWPWYLDPNYPRRIVDSSPFRQFGPDGSALWYICEIYARAEYYRLLLAGDPRVNVHDFELKSIATAEGAEHLLESLGEPRPAADLQMPPPQNANTNEIDFGPQQTAATNRLIEGLQFDPKAVARAFFDSGKRL